MPQPRSANTRNSRSVNGIKPDCARPPGETAIRFVPLIAAGLICLVLTGVSASAAPRGHAPERSPQLHYFIEFRAREGGILGHTFIVYGRTDRRGFVAEAHYAGIYPVGEFSESLILPVLVVPGRVLSKVEESKFHVTGFYRRWLSAAEYARVKAAVRRLKTERRWWQFFIYNCNSFVAEIATTLGMRTPFPLEEPSVFLARLRAINED